MRNWSFVVRAVLTAGTVIGVLSGCRFGVPGKFSFTESTTPKRVTTVFSSSKSETKTIVVNGREIMTTTTVTHSSSRSGVTRLIEKTVPAASLQKVSVGSDFGGITFVPTKNPEQVEVHAEITLDDSRFSEADREKYIKGFTVQSQVENSVLNIFAEPPADFPKGIGFGATFRVGVPARVALDGKTSNGAVLVENVHTTGSITARSDFGEIKVLNSGKSVDARTSNGSVTITNSEMMRQVEAHSDFGAIHITGNVLAVDANTSNGAVTVQGAENATRVNAKSDFGNVTVSNCGGTIRGITSNGKVTYSGKPESIRCKSDFGSIDAVLGEGANPTSTELTTSNGAVHLRVPASASLTFHAETSNGNISATGINGQTSGDNFNKSYSGTLNDGKNPVTVRTDFGSITLVAHTPVH